MIVVLDFCQLFANTNSVHTVISDITVYTKQYPTRSFEFEHELTPYMVTVPSNYHQWILLNLFQWQTLLLHPFQLGKNIYKLLVHGFRCQKVCVLTQSGVILLVQAKKRQREFFRKVNVPLSGTRQKTCLTQTGVSSELAKTCEVLCFDSCDGLPLLTNTTGKLNVRFKFLRSKQIAWFQ